MLKDEEYMSLALEEAAKAYQMGEVPIGAVLVNNEDGTIMSRGHNLRKTKNDATAHAEMEVIREANQLVQGWRLLNCTMYVTIEPCAMCAGAMVNSRIERLVYGSTEPRSGAIESLFNVVNHKLLNHHMEVRAGVLEDECRDIMKRFFKMCRAEVKARKKAAREAAAAQQEHTDV